MSTEKQVVTEARKPTEKWRHLPERTRVEDTVESVPELPGPASPTLAGDPDTAWMLRYA